MAKKIPPKDRERLLSMSHGWLACMKAKVAKELEDEAIARLDKITPSEWRAMEIVRAELDRICAEHRRARGRR